MEIEGTLHWRDGDDRQRETPVKLEIDPTEANHRIGLGDQFYALQGDDVALREQFTYMPEGVEA